MKSSLNLIEKLQEIEDLENEDVVIVPIRQAKSQRCFDHLRSEEKF